MAEAGNRNEELDKNDSLKQSKSVSNTFSNALQIWNEIDLPTLQKQLDEQGLELKDEQKNSLINRKNLASRTKEFKKLSDEEKLEQFKSLLKLYQNEIDSLTNKKKTVENYFFGIYRLLAEAPDPRPLLEGSLDAVIESSQAESLKREIDRLNEELSKRADYDQVKQKLLITEQRSAETLSAKLNAKDEEWKDLLDEKESNWDEKEKTLNSRIKEAQKKIQELRTSKEVTELQLNSQQQNSQPVGSASVLAELDIVSRDAETSKRRVLELERRNEELRKNMSNYKSDSKNEEFKKDYEKRILELEGDNATLMASLNQTRRRMQNISDENEQRLSSHKREMSSLGLEIKNLKERLTKTSDYDEIKHELMLLRQIQFGQEDNEEDVSKEIDSILVSRNKVLTQNLADYRSQHENLVKKVESLQVQLTNVNEDLIKSRELNIKLENDLANFQDISNGGKFNDTMSFMSGMTRNTRGPSKAGSVTLGTSTASPAEDSSILPIITKQRDRFRDRNKELEEELKRQQNTLNDLKRQTASLRRDNEELYERTRYLAAMKDNISDASSRQRSTFRPKANIDLEMNPYQRSYESKLHPIEQFRMKEQERINSKLSPFERMFISFTRAILATRTSRMLFMLYCMGLHCVVMFVTLYSMNLHTSMIPEVGLNQSTGGVATTNVNAASGPDAAAPNPVI